MMKFAFYNVKLEFDKVNPEFTTPSLKFYKMRYLELRKEFISYPYLTHTRKTVSEKYNRCFIIFHAK